MNYNDKVTLKLKENYQNRDGEKSDRQKRRESKKNYNKFITKAYKYLNKDWLDSIDEDIKISLSHDWYVANYRNRWLKKPVEFSEWIKSSFKNIKPNTSVYRNTIINSLLNEGDSDN